MLDITSEILSNYLAVFKLLTASQTVLMMIRWHHQKPAHLDLQCYQKWINPVSAIQGLKYPTCSNKRYAKICLAFWNLLQAYRHWDPSRENLLFCCKWTTKVQTSLRVCENISQICPHQWENMQSEVMCTYGKCSKISNTSCLLL